MREILFRAKRLDNGEWVEGLLIHICLFSINENEEIDEEYVLGIQRLNKSYQIDPTTLCQYTSLEDMNGKKIFENDIVEVWEDDEKCDYIIVWDDCILAIEAETRDGRYRNNTFSLHAVDSICVIGNIFDNPELLEERK